MFELFFDCGACIETFIDPDGFIDHCYIKAGKKLNPKDVKPFLANTIAKIRNHIVHKYKNGKLKKMSESKIPKHFVDDGNRFNTEMLELLCARLEKILRILFYTELGLSEDFLSKIYNGLNTKNCVT
ncbi:MAG: hypothetical protein LBI30_04160 [Holosporales bacterium]|nr:hypothetical protein [Holosporales bacterium]